MIAPTSRGDRVLLAALRQPLGVKKKGEKGSPFKVRAVHFLGDPVVFPCGILCSPIISAISQLNDEGDRGKKGRGRKGAGAAPPAVKQRLLRVINPRKVIGRGCLGIDVDSAARRSTFRRRHRGKKAKKGESKGMREKAATRE